MNIQYASNLPTLRPRYLNVSSLSGSYVTFEDSLQLEQGINVLILSGNICDPYDPMYEKFIKWCSNMVSNVLITAGSVEYNNRDKNVVDEHIQNMVNRLNDTSNYGMLVYLQKNTFNISNVEFIGPDAKIAKEPERIYGKDARYVLVTDVDVNNYDASLDCVLSGNDLHILKSACVKKSSNSFTIEYGLPVWRH